MTTFRFRHHWLHRWLMKGGGVIGLDFYRGIGFVVSQMLSGPKFPRFT